MHQAPLPPPVRRLKELAAKADGFLWGSPEYHGGCSGVLKNALDWLTTDEMAGKPVALIAVAGGSMGGMSTLNELRVVARNVSAWVMPQQVSIGSSDDAFDGNGRPVDKKVERRLHELGRRLVAAAKVFPQMR